MLGRRFATQPDATVTWPWKSGGKWMAGHKLTENVNLSESDA